LDERGSVIPGCSPRVRRRASAAAVCTATGLWRAPSSADASSPVASRDGRRRLCAIAAARVRSRFRRRPSPEPPSAPCARASVSARARVAGVIRVHGPLRRTAAVSPPAMKPRAKAANATPRGSSAAPRRPPRPGRARAGPRLRPASADRFGHGRDAPLRARGECGGLDALLHPAAPRRDSRPRCRDGGVGENNRARVVADRE
jgi:hypothetical protein